MVIKTCYLYNYISEQVVSFNIYLYQKVTNY